MNVTKSFGNSMYMTRLPKVALLVFVIAVLASCELENGESASPHNILFSAEAGDNVDIYKIDEESDDIVRLTTNAERDFSPAWSPNKSSIAFLSERTENVSLWILVDETNTERQVSKLDSTVTGFRWAPDSTRIAVEILEDGIHHIAVINVDNGKSEQITPVSEDARLGDWSPDGQWLTYAVTEGDERGIKRRNPTGVDEISITSGDDSNPVWSPDGKWIAFNRTSDDGSNDLMVADRSGESVTNLVPDQFDESHFEWSPKSEQIVFQSDATGNMEIYTVDPEGKTPEQLTSNRVVDTSPLWSADGSFILFQSESDGSFDLYTMKPDGDRQDRKTTFDGRILEADW